MKVSYKDFSLKETCQINNYLIIISIINQELCYSLYAFYLFLVATMR